MKFLPNKIFEYHLYIFQLEEYDIKRFFTAIKNKGIFPPSSLRKQAVWTSKAKALTLLSLIIQLILSIAISYLITLSFNLNLISFLIILLFTTYFLFISSFFFLAQSQDILLPLETYKKNKIIKKASKKIHNLKDRNQNLKIIGITGSYGKTTMKEVIKEILGIKFKVVSTFENQNTPIGISRKILNDVDESTEVFIVEMGEYVKGDVDKICKITPPDISIITGINEAHLERYGTMQNAIDTKFEIVENTKPEGLVLLNADDELTVSNYERFESDKTIQWFSSKNNKLSRYKVENVDLDMKNLGLNFEVRDLEFDSMLIFKTKFLAEYAIGNVIASLIIGRELGMNDNQIKIGANKIKPVEHRLEPSMLSDDILLIDDTYNGNSDGIKEGISLLKKFKNRRKVYITPGLVETGELSEDIHLEIGKQLSSVADIVVLIRNSVTEFIEKGLLESGFNKENIIWFENGKETYSSLRTFVKGGDVVMMQNDWSDNYF